MSHIEDVYLGRWTNPRTGEKAPRAPVARIEILDTVAGREAELVRSVGINGEVHLVADTNTHDVLGHQVAKALRSDGFTVHEVILPGRPHATLSEMESLKQKLVNAEAAIAVGSGTINDLTKFVAAQQSLPYCVFGTAPSMDGYASSTASMGLESGLKVSLPAKPPRGVFLDISVLAAAPPHMAAAGFGDCLCNSVARIDWWMSHRVLDTQFWFEPYLVTEPDDGLLEENAEAIGNREHVAIGYLTRALVLSGMGVNFTGVSNHGSMGEHQISHYIDCFARERHPGTLHGQQVGVATLSMGRIQSWFLDQAAPPKIMPTKIDPDDMTRRMGPAIARQCEEEYRKKALDADGAARLNERLQEIWPQLREECRALQVPVEHMKRKLAEAGGATSGAELGLPSEFYREAVRHAHEMRNRFSFADLACDAGLLDGFAASEA
ncbi:iron-containing alcohol dehydrogenase [Roseibium sediminis]|uniref:iron-containing alcohol dehydrogenase n=1 Tax=Roseibium sediminis TaxID=1775174 RepID=UPI00195D66E2|nr:iron-containing alcohol dehydrogenase [Roseibium sediminis]